MKRGLRSKGVGRWAFLIGMILALALGFVGRMTPEIVAVLVIIGIMVGFLNVNKDEIQPFLLSGVVLVFVSVFGQTALSTFAIFERMLDALLIIFIPAVIVVAVKNVFNIAIS